MKADDIAQTDIHRGPWEIEASALAVALAEQLPDYLATPLSQIEEESAADAGRFP